MLTIAKMLAILASLLAMAGCGLQHSVNNTSVAGYPYRHSDFDYKYAWKSVATDQGVVIDGVMKNVRYPFISSVQLTVFVVDKDDKIRAKESTFPMPQQSRENDVSQFTLLLKGIKLSADDVFEFHVHYTGDEGGDGNGVDWISNFKVNALTGADIRTPNRNMDEW